MSELDLYFGWKVSVSSKLALDTIIEHIGDYDSITYGLIQNGFKFSFGEYECFFLDRTWSPKGSSLFPGSENIMSNVSRSSRQGSAWYSVKEFRAVKW